jgi:hypothetical protein
MSKVLSEERVRATVRQNLKFAITNLAKGFVQFL